MFKYVLMCCVLSGLACSGGAFSSSSGDGQLMVEADAGANDAIDAGVAMGGGAGPSAGGSETGGHAGVSAGGSVAGGGAGMNAGGSAIRGSAGVSTGGVASGGNGGVGGEAGSLGGSAGATVDFSCSEFPVRELWTASASPENPVEPSEGAIDDDGLYTRWVTLETTMGGEWLAVDFSEDVVLNGVKLRTLFEQGESYSISVDDDVVATGEGDDTSSIPVEVVLSFPPVRGRLLKVTQTGSKEASYWSVYDLSPICD